MQERLSAEWEISVRGIVPPPDVTNCEHQKDILGRLVTWNTWGISWEADPRHVETLCRDLGVTGAKVTTPSIKSKETSDEEDPRLPTDQVTMFRSLAMRASYASQDRPDLQQACRELAKGMSEPHERHMKALKRPVRLLNRKPRLVQCFRNQDTFRDIVGWSDADHAGCVRTRKSTSGGVIQLGNGTLKTYCRGQAVISLSSGESEYYSLVSIMSESLGLQRLLKDWAVKVGYKIWMDAASGKSLGSRRGLGKAKHINTVFLWIQSYVTEGKVRIGKRHIRDASRRSNKARDRSLDEPCFERDGL